MTTRQKKIGPEGVAGSAAARRARGLLRRREVRSLLEAASSRGERVWLAGGAARDLLLARPVLDLDVVATGDIEALARDLERAGAGRSVELSREVPRVFRIARPRREIDLVELTGGSIERDLGRRDFTVNAIALDLKSRLWIDPFRGIADLKKRRLRMVSEENLADDPLRALRAARLYGTHGLIPDQATSLACRRAAAGLPGVAAERIRSEIVKLFEAPRAAAAFRWACRTRVAEQALSIPARLAGRLALSARLFDSPALLSQTSESRARLRLTLLCAAMGLSAPEAPRWLAARRFGRGEAGSVGRLLDLVRKGGEARSAREEWAWIYDAGPLAGEAAILLSLLEPGKRRKASSLARRAANRFPARPRITGADVLAWSGLPPGPGVGELLREIRIEILTRKIRSRGEARQWVASRSRELVPAAPIR